MSVDIHTLAGAYALDAVTDIERAAFDRHLADCPSCAQELAELRATVSRLTDLTPVAPPARLKQAVLTSAAQTRQIPPRRSVERARSKSWRTWAAGVAAAAVVAVAGGAVGYAISDQNTRSAKAQIAAQQQQDTEITQVMTASDATAHSEPLPGGGQINIVVSASLNRAVVVAKDMPKITTSQAYQLWWIHPTGPAASAGLMPGGSTGGTVVLDNIDGATAFGVSLEKATGAATPSSPLVTQFAI